MFLIPGKLYKVKLISHFFNSKECNEDGVLNPLGRNHALVGGAYRDTIMFLKSDQTQYDYKRLYCVLFHGAKGYLLFGNEHPEEDIFERINI